MAGMSCFEESRLGKVCMAMVMCLCICVMVQMLGVPITLLNFAEAADISAASVLEGFSVLPAVPRLTPSENTISVTDVQSSLHLPIFVSAPFHPPDL
jgi:hypothetical protein